MRHPKLPATLRDLPLKPQGKYPIGAHVVRDVAYDRTYALVVDVDAEYVYAAFGSTGDARHWWPHEIRFATLPLWLIERTDHPAVEEIAGFVIAAPSVKVARRVASWANAGYPTYEPQMSKDPILADRRDLPFLLAAKVRMLAPCSIYARPCVVLTDTVCA